MTRLVVRLSRCTAIYATNTSTITHAIACGIDENDTVDGDDGDRALDEYVDVDEAGRNCG